MKRVKGWELLGYNILINMLPRNKRPHVLRKMGVLIGEGCEVYRDVSFGSEPFLINIGNNVRITTGVKFCTHDGGIFVLRNIGKCTDNDNIFGNIRVGDNVHIGWNSIIMPNVHVGNNVIIGVNTVVTKDIPSDSVVAGCPAHVICTLDDYYNKHIGDIERSANY